MTWQQQNRPLTWREFEFWWARFDGLQLACVWNMSDLGSSLCLDPAATNRSTIPRPFSSYLSHCITWATRKFIQIASRYKLDGQGSNPGVGEIFRTRPDRPWSPPTLPSNGYRFFPGDKAAGAWRWPPSPSSAEVKERIELYLYSTSGLRGLL
jgi:hypothetical protein